MFHWEEKHVDGLLWASTWKESSSLVIAGMTMPGKQRGIERGNPLNADDVKFLLSCLLLWSVPDEYQLRVLQDYGCVCGAVAMVISW